MLKLQKFVCNSVFRTGCQSTRRLVACSSLMGSQNRKVDISQILVAKDKASTLDEIEADIKAEKSTFQALAEQHSECPSKKKGGRIGWLDRGVYFPEVEAAALATPVGGMARATTMRGHHLILVNDEKEEAVIQQMHVTELAELLGNPAELEEVQLVDVRESWEYDTSRLPGFKLFPLSQSQSWADNITEVLDPSKKTVVLCHHGVRSMNMSSFLVQQGFSDVHNVTGGIDAYSRGADPNVPLY